MRIVTFETYSSPGISTVKLADIRSLQTPIQTNLFENVDLLWHVGGRTSSEGRPRPNWSGFMQTVCQGDFCGTSAIEMLEIIDLNPSDETCICIYSTPIYVIGQAHTRSFATPSITFDQPLYIKTVDIAHKANLNIVIRLGGFHTLMSFLGSISHLMHGSGLEEIMGLMFGSNTIEHVLSGKAYARAVRGHFIVHSAPVELLMNHLRNPLSEEDSLSPVAASSEIVFSLAGSQTTDDISTLNKLYDDLLVDKVWVCDTDNTPLNCAQTG